MHFVTSIKCEIEGGITGKIMLYDLLLLLPFKVAGSRRIHEFRIHWKSFLVKNRAGRFWPSDFQGWTALTSIVRLQYDTHL